jgi:hypothetical protein
MLFRVHSNTIMNQYKKKLTYDIYIHTYQVIYKPHKINKDIDTFAHISTKNHDVKMTPTHILPGGVCGSVLPLVYASKVIDRIY